MGGPRPTERAARNYLSAEAPVFAMDSRLRGHSPPKNPHTKILTLKEMVRPDFVPKPARKLKPPPPTEPEPPMNRTPMSQRVQARQELQRQETQEIDMLAETARRAKARSGLSSWQLGENQPQLPERSSYIELALQQHELHRQQHESHRQHHDTHRLQYDSHRQPHDSHRQQQDSHRQSHDSYRQPHDSYRQQQDSHRQQQDSIRQPQDAQRQQPSKQRIGRYKDEADENEYEGAYAARPGGGGTLTQSSRAMDYKSAGCKTPEPRSIGRFKDPASIALTPPSNGK